MRQSSELLLEGSLLAILGYNIQVFCMHTNTGSLLLTFDLQHQLMPYPRNRIT